jgi:hypothetical protein
MVIMVDMACCHRGRRTHTDPYERQRNLPYLSLISVFSFMLNASATLRCYNCTNVSIT